MINNKDFKFAVILGSGLDSLTDNFKDKVLIGEDNKGIHQKKAYIVKVDTRDFLIFSGRKHYYEGYMPDELMTDVRQAKEMGVRYLLITNAAGGLNPGFQESDMMLIKTCVDMTRDLIHPKSYVQSDSELMSIFTNICRELKIKCHEGIYGYLAGPAYETKAEIRMLRKFNIDAVGMSTVPEVKEASALGMRVLAVSIITNLLKECNSGPADHNAVLNIAHKASPLLFSVILRLLNELN